MTKPSEEQILKNTEIVWKLVQTFPARGGGSEMGRKEMVEHMLNGPVGTHYFTAPASSREDFHSCFPGGLVHHSLNVVRNLKKLSSALYPGRWPDHQLAFVGLFHDFGKCGDGEQEFYVPNPSEYGRNRGFLYEINRKCMPGPNAIRGLYILQKNAIIVSQEEWLAILLNDGPIAEENGPYAMQEPDLALLVHWADRLACSQEKQGT
jgi:hypothetical protein